MKISDHLTDEQRKQLQVTEQAVKKKLGEKLSSQGMGRSNGDQARYL
ncbi:hypothetical protein [Peribacillus saganii]|nr:hypothetical protein [Peribacillus saganii]